MLQVATSMNESNAMIVGQWQVVLQINTNKMATAHMLQRKRAAYQDFFRLMSSSSTSAMFVYALHARARAQLAGKIHKPITGVFSRFVAWQVAAVVVIRATNPKFVAKSRSQVYFAQHVVATCIENCCTTSCSSRW